MWRDQGSVRLLRSAGAKAMARAHRIVDASARQVFNVSMKRILAALLLLTLAAPAWGQDLEKGFQAYERGDYQQESCEVHDNL